MQAYVAPLGIVENNTKIILFYTTYFEHMPWPDFGFSMSGLVNFTDLKGNICPIQEFKCSISYSHMDFNRSDAVVFHGSRMPPLRRLRREFKRKPRDQIWVWYQKENPVFTGYRDAAKLNGMFNWTTTYRYDSDIFIPDRYFRALTLAEKERFSSHTRNFAGKKDKLVVVALSHCGRLRDKIIQALSELVPVDVFGRCSKNFKRRANARAACLRYDLNCTDYMERYKFYLAFENEDCNQYITEKTWLNGYERGLVPVLIAGDAQFDSKLVVPGSYINILDFPNVKPLADYLLFLDKNDIAYKEYKKWRSIYTTFEPHWLCDACQKLHKPIQRKVWNNFRQFWGTDENCYIHNNYIENVWMVSRSRSSSVSSHFKNSFVALCSVHSLNLFLSI